MFSNVDASNLLIASGNLSKLVIALPNPFPILIPCKAFNGSTISGIVFNFSDIVSSFGATATKPSKFFASVPTLVAFGIVLKDDKLVATSGRTSSFLSKSPSPSVVFFSSPRPLTIPLNPVGVGILLNSCKVVVTSSSLDIFVAISPMSLLDDAKSFKDTESLFKPLKPPFIALFKALSDTANLSISLLACSDDECISIETLSKVTP